MFDNLTSRLSAIVSGLQDRKLSESNIQEALQEVRISLIQADVSLDVVIHFIDEVHKKAIGTHIHRALQPGDVFVRLVHETLVDVIGAGSATLKLDSPKNPAVVLLAGLQGSGKTTSAAKIAKFIRTRRQKRVATVSTDVYRPAAIEQLKTLAEQANIRFIDSNPALKPIKIARQAIKDSRRAGDDVLLIDTAGRLAIDNQMMAEISSLHRETNPVETLFVVDAMTGQDAAVTAKSFNETIPLTGVVLTKADGDARGGAALSVKYVTGTPLKFLGTAEDLDGLEEFHPDRIASRILGMGDVLTLLEDAERKIDKKKATRMFKKLSRGTGFDLDDYREQISQMAQMGGLDKLTAMLPTQMNSSMRVKNVDERIFTRHRIIIDSLTPSERRFPATLESSPSRKRRVAEGSGSAIQEVNQMLRKFKQLQRKMHKAGKQLKRHEPGVADSDISELMKQIQP